jgi:hypothetical protein
MSNKKNPGVLLQLQDGRKAIVYNDQPLKSKGMIFLHLVDDNFKRVLNDEGEPKVLIWTVEKYEGESLEGKNKLIGYVD